MFKLIRNRLNTSWNYTTSSEVDGRCQLICVIWQIAPPCKSLQLCFVMLRQLHSNGVG